MSKTHGCVNPCYHVFTIRLFQWCLPHFVQFLFKILIFTDQEHVYMSLCPKKTDSRIKEKSCWLPFSVDLSDNSCFSVPQSPRVYGSAAGNTPGEMKSWSILDLLQRHQQKGHIYIDAKCMCVYIYIYILLYIYMIIIIFLNAVFIICNFHLKKKICDAALSTPLLSLDFQW